MPVAINVGPNPTFDESRMKVEAHIIGYNGDLYDVEIEIELLTKLRNVQKFESREQMLSQLTVDIERAESLSGTQNSH